MGKQKEKGFIHKAAEIDPSVKKGEGLRVHGRTVIMANVELGDNVEIWPYTFIGPGTKIGEGSIIYPGTQIGQFCTIGDRVELMGSKIPGNVTIDDYATVSEASVHQFCHIGEGSFIAAGTTVRKDVPPYVAVADYRGIVQPMFLNEFSANKKGISQESMDNYSELYQILYSSKSTVSEAAELMRKHYSYGEAMQLVKFIDESERGVYLKKKIKLPEGMKSEGRLSTLKWIAPALLYEKSSQYQSTKKILEARLKRRENSTDK